MQQLPDEEAKNCSPISLRTARTGHLGLLSVRLQTIQLHCPWQNGRIERLFGSFKRHLKHIVLRDRADLVAKLLEFRAWYNHARPHQHLHGQTPAEVWAGRGKFTKGQIVGLAKVAA